MVSNTPKGYTDFSVSIMGRFANNFIFCIAKSTAIEVFICCSGDFYLTAILANPPEIPGQLHHIGVGTAANIAVIPAFFQNLNQTHRMTEAVKIDSSSRSCIKFFCKVFSTQPNLPHKGFPGGHIAVRLKIPATHNVPLSGFYLFLNAGKQLRVVFLNKFIENRFIMVKDKIKFLTEQFRLMEGGNCLTIAFLPIPHPNRIQMRVADQMNLFHKTLLSTHSHLSIWSEYRN